jgi:hypothetical protein
MLAHKALKTLLLTFILILGSLLPVFLIPVAHAENSQGYTTLYFTNALNLENTTDLGVAGLTQTPPTSQKDSEYPPSILAKNGILGKNNTLISEEWFTWLSSALIGQILGNISGNNSVDLGGLEGLELLFPGLNRISEVYTYNGNDTLNIRGDIIYHLYFSDTRKIKKLTDSVDVSLYTISVDSLFGLPTRRKNTTVLLTPPKYLGGIYDQQITLPNINYTLTTGDTLLVSIEIIPTNKSTLALDILSSPILKKTVQWMVNRWENNITHGPLRRQIGALIKNVTTLLEDTGNESGINFTSDDIASFINAMKSSRLIYDSQSHPSSITIPVKISEEDIRIYYLHSGQAMSEIQQEGTNTSKTEKVDITTTPKIWTADQGLERNKILKVQDVTAELYFYRFLFIIHPKVSVTVTLYDDNTSIASTERQLTKKEIQGFLRKKITPVVFNFTGVDKEITYGHKLGIGISLSNGTKTVFTKLKLQYNSIQYPSSLRVKFEETQNIQIHDLITTPSDGKIIPGGSVQYLFNVTSLKTDTLQIKTIEREKTGAWSISTPTSVTVSAGGWVTIPMYVNSSNILKEAYGSLINLIVIITGNTGIARQAVTAEISEEAINYKVEILGYSNSINISKGENHFFYFVVKNNNTGAIDDADNYTVTASSKNHWPLIPQETIRNLGIGETSNADDARVLIQVPKNTTETSDVITITVTSEGSSDASATITITVNVIGGGPVGGILDFFDSAARSLGLNDIFGSDAKFVLLIILVVIILFFLIILALVLTSKPVRIICTDRIKELDATEKAIFEVTLTNPYKKTQSYEIEAQQTAISSKWIIAIDPATTVIEGRASKTIQVTVTPTDAAEPKEWTEVTVSVKKIGKKKKASIDLMTMMKEGKTLLQLENVSHWPTTFNPGERIVTSFNLSNNGTLSARNVKVFFYLNGKQKNTVEVTLLPGNIADIQIPWIAEKGKNHVRIRVKE